jgi:hypothetical protein
MNGRELSSTTSSDVSRETNATDASEREREREHFALAIAGCLQQSVPVRAIALGVGNPDASDSSPAGWRPGVDALTPNAELRGNDSSVNCVPNAASAEANEDPQRLQVRVRTKELGEIALIVERADHGLRVQVGAVDAAAVSQLIEQSAAVRLALESGGHSIDSLEIVRMDSFGTDLAQPRVALSSRTRRKETFEESATTSGDKKKKAKRLNLIG